MMDGIQDDIVMSKVISGRDGGIFALKPFGIGFAFGNIFGVGRFRFLIPSPLCMHWLLTRSWGVNCWELSRVEGGWSFRFFRVVND